MEIAKSLVDESHKHLFRVRDLNQPTYLSLDEIRRCPGSEEDLENLIKVVRYSADKYFNSKEKQVEIFSEEIVAHLHMENLAVRKVGLMLPDSLTILTMQNNISIGTWNFVASNDVARFDGVMSVDDFFEKRDALYKARNRGNSKINALIENIAKADQSDMKAIGVSSLELSAGYYNEPLKQSQQSFLWARGSTVVGFLFFIAAITFLLFRQPQNIAIICTIGGAISAFIVRTFYVLYQNTSKQALAYKPQVDRAQNFIMASSACESMDEERKHRVREELVKWFVGLPPITDEDKK